MQKVNTSIRLISCLPVIGSSHEAPVQNNSTGPFRKSGRWSVVWKEWGHLDTTNQWHRSSSFSLSSFYTIVQICTRKRPYGEFVSWKLCIGWPIGRFWCFHKALSSLFGHKDWRNQSQTVISLRAWQLSNNAVHVDYLCMFKATSADLKYFLVIMYDTS